LQRKGIPAGIFVVTETLGRHYLHVYDKLFLLLARVLPMIDHDAERLTTLCESHDVPLARQHGLKDVIKDPFDTMRLLFTTLTQKQLRRAIEALETVVQIRDEDFPALHSLTWDMVRALDRAGMTIGSHTQTHALLTLENPKRMANQIVGSLLTLQEKLGKPVTDDSAKNLVGEFLTRSVRGVLEHPHALSRPLDFRSLPPLPAGP
jgi:peptidoglycan/xylan/chitin deacetylase (PgdA/CDA1 family)